MKYYFETRHFHNFEEGTTLFADTSKTVIQELQYEDTVLCETIIPCVHKEVSEKSEEISMMIDEKLLKLFKLFKVFSIDSEKVFFEDISYEYPKGEVLKLESRFPPQLRCMFTITDTLLLEDDREKCHIYVDEKVHINFEHGLHLEQKTFKTFSNCSKVKFNFELLRPIFEDHKSQVCKMYLDTDSPISLEFLNDTTVRYHVAPLYDE